MAKQEQKNNKEKKPIYKKWWFWVLIVLGVIIIIVAISGGNKDAQKVDSNNSNTNSSQTETKNRFKVGETFEIDGLQISVDKVEHNYADKYVKPQDGKEFVLITVTYKNSSSSKQNYNTYNWKIGDSNGSLEGTKFVTDQPNSLNYGELTAGGTKTGTLAFEAPLNDKGLTLHYSPNAFNTNREVVIDLQ